MSPPMTGASEMVVLAERATILPVIHYADDNQAMRNAERAIEAGCAGVMLIEMQGRNKRLLFAGAAIKRRWPTAHIGINHLGMDAGRAVHNSIAVGVDSTWTDEQLTHSGGALDAEATRLSGLISSAPLHAIFCAVAFKYQRHEPDPALAAIRALHLGFIPTTSGAGTGFAADRFMVEAIREGIGEAAPLALASGVTPDNAASFAPLVSHILVATGVSSSFHEFDPARLRALVQVVDDYPRARAALAQASSDREEGL
jgi:predicted TIM-barrel enzyme